jgi:hypothetical protein
VRQRCGYGCVICGASIIEYEHFAPDFAQAKEHCADGITILCPKHHSHVTKGIISKKQVAQANLTPKARALGFSREDHPWFIGLPSLKLGGGMVIHETPIPLQFKGENVLEFSEPEDGSGVTRVSLKLCDALGSQLLTVSNNEWRVHSGTWDFESVGNRYIFKDSAKEVVLQLRMLAPKMIQIETLKTTVQGVDLDVTVHSMKVGGGTFNAISVSGCKIGLSIG